nr:hypothetical protein CFP56_21006 [Quercus suber]POF01060.1 hypothetical protein CFP56_21008 [Quercus suber]
MDQDPFQFLSITVRSVRSMAIASHAAHRERPHCHHRYLSEHVADDAETCCSSQEVEHRARSRRRGTSDVQPSGLGFSEKSSRAQLLSRPAAWGRRPGLLPSALPGLWRRLPNHFLLIPLSKCIHITMECSWKECWRSPDGTGSCVISRWRLIAPQQLAFEASIAGSHRAIKHTDILWPTCSMCRAVRTPLDIFSFRFSDMARVDDGQKGVSSMAISRQFCATQGSLGHQKRSPADGHVCFEHDLNQNHGF